MLSLFEAPARRLVTVSDDGLLSVWDTATCALVQQHPRPTHLAVQWTSVAWGGPADGNAAAATLAVGSDSGVVVVWELAQARILHELRGHTQRVTDLAYEAGGRKLLSCGRDRQVLCWSVSDGQLLHSFAAGQAAVERLVVTSASEHVLLASSAIRVLRRDTWKKLTKLPGHAGRVTCLSVSSDHELAASSANDRHVSVWRVGSSSTAAADDACVQTLALDTTVCRVAFDATSAPGSHSLLVLTTAGIVHVWAIDGAAVRPRSGSSGGGKKKRAADANSAAPPMPPAAPCRIRVEHAADGGGGDDALRIFDASFCGGMEVSAERVPRAGGHTSPRAPNPPRVHPHPSPARPYPAPPSQRLSLRTAPRRTLTLPLPLTCRSPSPASPASPASQVLVAHGSTSRPTFTKVSLLASDGVSLVDEVCSSFHL